MTGPLSVCGSSGVAAARAMARDDMSVVSFLQTGTYIVKKLTEGLVKQASAASPPGDAAEVRGDPVSGDGAAGSGMMRVAC